MRNDGSSTPPHFYGVREGYGASRDRNRSDCTYHMEYLQYASLPEIDRGRLWRSRGATCASSNNTLLDASALDRAFRAASQGATN